MEKDYNNLEEEREALQAQPADDQEDVEGAGKVEDESEAETIEEGDEEEAAEEPTE